ncbi:hypothetical protein [Pseudomonas sp. HMWF006]|uniref:hypothetical protein n=1 Tax=Pseudomonas sp. HMWF006 TaxID=2056843 RepID=UPI0015ADD48A|nr:hypothetical protein [Pseudomonas sp. HMWF006]
MQISLDAVREQMRDAEAILQQLDLTLEAIRFDPSIPSSVAAAAKQTSAVIDSHLAGFRGNPVLAPLVDQLKIQYLENIEHKVVASKGAQLKAANPLARAWNILRRSSKAWK